MAASSPLLSAERSVLLLVDIQERFRASIPALDRVIARAAILAKAAARLGVPVLASEQYPKALGSTVGELLPLLPDPAAVFPKLCFSASGCEPLLSRLKGLSGLSPAPGGFGFGARHDAPAAARRQIVICGVEAHVCVLQTALELQSEGFAAHVVEDAVASRAESDRASALDRMARHGVERVTSEMVVFEWLRAAGTPEFKELQALIK
jgi:nicotinamidase-related amidase